MEGCESVLAGLGGYFYVTTCLYLIARKTGTPRAWLAFIPIVQLFLVLLVAEDPLWWIIWFFVPVVNLIVAIVVWMAIARRCGKPSWIGALIVVPVVDVILIGYLAFSGSPEPEPQGQAEE